MSPKRTIKSKEIVSDIRSWMSNQQLMDKYHISLDRLQNVFKQLIDAGAIERGELVARHPHERLSIENLRNHHRNYVFVGLPIYDLKNLLKKGTVIDISEVGLQISGVPTNVGDTKDLLIQADYFVDVYPFIFEAQCRWVSMSEYEKLLSGFEVTSITDGGLEELRKLTRMLTIHPKPS